MALIGTIAAALVTATATVTAAVQQHNGSPPTPSPITTTYLQRSAPSLPPPTTTSTTPATSDGVTHHCTGSAPNGIDIVYGPSGSEFQATSVPFTAHDSVNESAEDYGGSSVTSSSAAEDTYNIADPQVPPIRRLGVLHLVRAAAA